MRESFGLGHRLCRPIKYACANGSSGKCHTVCTTLYRNIDSRLIHKTRQPGQDEYGI